MSGCVIEEGIYTLRIVTIGQDPGKYDGMYATQEEFSASIEVAAQTDKTADRQSWRIMCAENNTCYIDNGHKCLPDVQPTGFHNLSVDNDAPVTLDVPKRFIVEPVGDVPFGKNVYTIRPTEVRIGVDMLVGIDGNKVVTKDFPVGAPFEARPAWHFYRQ